MCIPTDRIDVKGNHTFEPRLNWDQTVNRRIPLGFSISDGIAFGFISYVFLKLATRQFHQIPWPLYLFAALFLLRYTLAQL